MRRTLYVLSLCLALAPLAQASLPYINIASDVQRPDEEFVITRVYSGNTPMIRWLATDNDSPADLSGWSFALWYARNNSATAGYAVAQASISSNAVLFSSITNFFAVPNDYYVSVLGTHTSGYVRTWGVGRMNQKWDFASNGPTGIPPSQTSLNWNQFLSYSGTWPFFAGSNVTVNTTATGITINASALSAVATNGINNVLTASGTTNGVSLTTNTLTVTFSTNATASGTLSGAYSTSALLTLAVSGTNVVGGLSSAVATGGQWNASVAGASNLALGAYALASNAVPQLNGTFSGLLSGGNDGEISALNGYFGGLFVTNSELVLSGAAGITIEGSGAFIGNASGLTNIPLAALAENVATTGQWNASVAGASNLASTAYSTATNRAPASTLSNMPPVFAARGTVSYMGYQGTGINDMPNRLDIRSTNRTYAIMGLYATADGQDNYWGVPAGLDLWNFNSTSTASFAANQGSPVIGLGLHNANLAQWTAKLYTLARGTNDGCHDLIFAVSRQTSPYYPERMRITTEGNVIVSNTVRAGAFVGDGSGLTNLPIHATGATVTQTPTGTVIAVTAGGGAAQSPWTNTVNASVYSLTNAADIQASRFFIGTDTNIFFWRSGTNLYLRQYGVDGLFGQ